MNAIELRLGNLVQYVDTKEPCTIYEIEHRFKKTYRINDLNDNRNIEPIPITEEWLLKFGFKSEKIRGGIFFIQGLFRLWGDKKNNITRISSQSSSILNIDVKSVHQLQNLYFSLTGKELEIK